MGLSRSASGIIFEVILQGVNFGVAGGAVHFAAQVFLFVRYPPRVALA